MTIANVSLMKATSHPLLVIAPDNLTAMRWFDEMQFFNSGDPEFQLIYFPDWETLPYDHFSPHHDIISERLAALHHIPLVKKGVILISITTLMHRLPPVSYLTGNLFLFKTGDKLSIDVMRKQLGKAGYHCVTEVREHGEFAVRGSILDLYPTGSELPFRIDLFDEEIDSIRTFSPETQRSLDKIDKIELLPAKEFPLSTDAIDHFRSAFRGEFSGNPLNCPLYQDITEGICTPGIEYYLPLFFDNTAVFFDYLPEKTAIVTPDGIHQKADLFWKEIHERYEQYRHDQTHPLLPPEKLFVSPDIIVQKIRSDKNNIIQTTTHHLPLPQLMIDPKSEKPLQQLEKFISDYTGRILFCAESTGRREVLLTLLNTISLHPTTFPSWKAFQESTSHYGIIVAPLEEGFSLEESRLVLITESDLMGKRMIQNRRRKTSTQDPDLIIKNLAELQIGSPIVHIDHGVGRYLGLQTLDIGEQLTEFLSIEYANAAKLYVPVASLHLVSRYSGMDAEHAPLSHLGTDQWQRAKKKAAEQIRDVAAELLDVYAHRAAEKGINYTYPEQEYATFSAGFPFEETPDQQQAINQVIADMTSEKLMDRLVCGDVGFGKTEVAMRAAFVAVQNSKQVIVLVPTTLLAQQHFQNFQDRFADWPIQIDVISRFKTAKEQASIRTRLMEGKIDIVIGTHKLLQETIQLKSLGLIIIDEEHRFGVRQKEKLKSLRKNVDILTLTATPIPRTLNMAFSGIRDLSLIATPPARRLSVKTFVHDYQTQLVQEAVLREILRGGQVYFLHNDVSTIEKMARDLQTLVPEARIGVAHGQMHERNLEQVMSDFYHRRFNLLVCSTIIESGIDIPSANTIIINRADKFGLAQLHQLRGRVGRSHHQAYAYLLIPSRKTLKTDAEKRLYAIASLEDLGVGFTLATHDLEIRGAGELLGEDQSGNMQAIGFTLYMDLLSRAVDALKEGKKPDLEKNYHERCEIDLHIPALIPESYLADVHLRLQFYKRIASTKTQDELDAIQVEMIDRFGLLPEPAKNLFALHELKQKAESLGILKLEANAQGGKITFSEHPKIDPMKIIKLIQTQPDRYKLDGPTQLKFTLKNHETKDRLQLIALLLETMQK